MDDKNSPKTIDSPMNTPKIAADAESTPTTAIEPLTPNTNTSTPRTAITPGLAIFSSDARTTAEPTIDDATINAMRSGSLFGKSKDALKEAPPLNDNIEVAVTPTKTTTTAVEPVTPMSTAATPTATPKTAIHSSMSTPKTAVQSTPTTPMTAVQSSLRTPKTAVQSSTTTTPKTSIRSSMSTPRTAIQSSTTPRTAIHSSLRTPNTAVQSSVTTTPKTAIRSSMTTPRTAIQPSMSTPQQTRSCRRSVKTPMSATKTAISSKTPLSRPLGTTTPKTAVTRTPLNTAVTPGTQFNTAASGTGTPTTARAHSSLNTAYTPGGLSCKTAKTLRTPGDASMNTAYTPGGLSCKTAKTLRTPGAASMKTAKVPKTPSEAAVPLQTPLTPKIKTASCKTAKMPMKEQTTPVTSGQKKARRSLFPNLKIQEPKSSKSDSRSIGQKKRNSKRSPVQATVSAKSGRSSIASGRSSIATGRSFDPPGTPHTCHEIPPHILAEQKAEQQKIILSTSTADGQFNVEIRIKMKVVGGGTEPQAMIAKKITVNGEDRYTSGQL